MEDLRSGAKRSWSASFQAFLQPSVIKMLFLGFSAGLPILLIFSTLSFWLRDSGVERASVTFFSWAALSYSFKFIWAPIIDRLPLPFLYGRLGQRRSWLLLTQLFIIVAIIGMGMTNPTGNLPVMALFTVLLGFSSASQDVVIDAYRIEAAEVDMQPLLSASYIGGYRLGMLLAGAGAVRISAYFDASAGQADTYLYASWQSAYLIMAAAMLIGVVTTFIITEPERPDQDNEARKHSMMSYARFFMVFLVSVVGFVGVFFLSKPLVVEIKQTLRDIFMISPHIIGFVVETARLVIAMSSFALIAWGMVRLRFVSRQMVKDAYVAPISDFFERYGQVALMILALIMLYRISDIVLGAIANVFYLDLQFEKAVIADVALFFGMIMTIVGGALGGLLCMRYGMIKILILGAVLSALTNLLFVALAHIGADVGALSVVIAADNISAGIAGAAFVAYLSSLTSLSFTATQYALFSSLMTLFPKLLAGYSGTMVDAVGYDIFFIGTALLGVPVIILIFLINKREVRI